MKFKQFLSVIPKNFQVLTDEFCTLGSNIEFYSTLKEKIGYDECMKVLYSLSDCTVNPIIARKFRCSDGFRRSLIRNVDAERALREAIFKVNDIPMDKSYDFDYVLHNGNETVKWKSHFKSQKMSYGRLLGLIGENGVGKTTLLKNLIRDLVNGKDECFKRKPLYSAVIVLNTSSYDGYEKVANNTSNLIYEVDNINVFNDDIVINRLSKIKSSSRYPWFSSLVKEMFFRNNYSFQDELNTLFSQMENDSISKIDDELVGKLSSVMSSGERHLFCLILYLSEKSWYNTLFVLDEPELHLHPQAITRFMSLLSKVLETFDSYAIIATHSPLIIREMMGENVFVMSKVVGDTRVLQSLDFECFGENISYLYKKIFDYDETQSNFYQTVLKLVKEGLGYNEILKEIETSDMPLSINSRIVIQNVISRMKNLL